MKKFFLVLCFAILPIQGFASEYDQAIDAAGRAHESVIANLTQAKLKEEARVALSNMFETAYGLLISEGHPKEAEQLRNEWRHSERYLLPPGGLENLGDHRPLSQWLADIYGRLQRVLGDRVLKYFRLDDIYTMNFAIPVVLQPAGDVRNGDRWNRGEYALHFVPFAGVVTYWAANRACRLALVGNPILPKLCRSVGGVFQKGVTLFVAPGISNFIYDRFGHGRADAAPRIDRNALGRFYRHEFGQVRRSLPR